jgi:hypothetical protein
MARIKKFGDTTRNLNTFSTYIPDTLASTDDTINNQYFRITEFKETFTGGKNGFLIEGSEHLLESSEIKIQILDVDGNPMYWEPGNGIPEYYEGISKVIAVYVYEDTPIGLANITILGELKTYIDSDGIKRDIPTEWKGVYNVKFEKTFKVNKLLSNEDKVRFYKRPKITIDEISRPIFTATPTLIQQTGFLNGTPLVPGEGVRLSTFTLPSSYLLEINDNTNWSGSILNGTVTMPNLGITFNPSNLVTNKQLIVSNPYSSNGLASSFSNQPYTANFTYLVEDSAIGTALSGSFAKISISDLTTFVGDVARVKVFRKSQSEVSDFQFVQEIALESNEILVDLESSERNQENYGLFTEYTLNNYWTGSSNSLTKTFNQNILFNSVKLDSVGANQFYTSKSIDITSGVEYTLDMNVKISGSISPTNYIKVYLQGTKDSKTVTQEIVTITSSNPYLQKTNINENIIANSFDTARLYFEVKGNDWYISDVSLRASQETSFSPDEITFIQPVQRNLESETFDFRFEFYDINNNYIPVEVLATKTFSGGNLNVINKSINLVPTSLYFQFDSGSGTGNPMAPTTIYIDAETNFITGSITFESKSYDIDNNELSSSYYVGGQYPGLLIDEGDNRYRLTVQNFTGSVAVGQPERIVQYVEYTANVEGVSDSIVITRVSDGKGGVNYEIRPYNGIVIRNSDASSSLEIQAVRIDGINEINLRNGLPLGKSDYQLFVQSGSTYITLAAASSSGFIEGLQPGLTGSGDINYNAIFNRDSIDGQITVYLIPSSSTNYSASILTSLTLTDLQDGLDAGVVLYDADTFSINPSPKLQTSESRFIPTSSLATASFYRRGTFENPISCSIELFPSMSINSGFNAEYWINYVTYSCDPDISIVVYDEIGNILSASLSASQGFRYDGNTDTYYTGSPNDQNKQLLVNFTYTEPWTSASVSVDKLFTIIPDGVPGEEPITFVITPSTVVIKANENNDVVSPETDFLPSQTVVSVKQGNRFLTYDQNNGGNGTTEKHGTFKVTTNGEPNIIAGFPSATIGATEVPITPITEFLDLTGTIKYTFDYQPYYSTASLTEFVTQSFTKVSNGTAARSVSLTSTADVVSYDGDGVVLSPTENIVITAIAYNTTGSAHFQYFKNDVSLGPPTSINFNGNILDIPSGDAVTPGETAIYRVVLRDGSGDENATIFAENQITITGIQSGGIPYNVSLTNENSSIFANVYDEITFTGTGTQVLASKGAIPLIAVNDFSASQFDQLGTVIPNGQYKVTIDSASPHITLATPLIVGSVVPNPNGIATIGDLSAWNYLRDPNTLLPLSSSAEIVYEIDIEDGKAVYYKTQSLSVQYEGAIGPGLIMRGEWTGSIDYIFDVQAKRRDAVFRDISGNVHYWGTTSDLVKSVSAPYTTIPFYDGSQQSGDIDVNGWQYLGQQDFFVAAKLAIFEESFVKNTINVGNNGGAETFANIVLAGGRVDPYIAVGQTGTAGNSGDQTSAGVIGYGNPGIFMGTKVTGSIKTPMMSLVNTGNTRFMRWDGSQLELSGKLNAGGMKLGPDVDGTNDGLYIGANNYWYDTGNFKVGDSNNYLEWDGATLTLRGSLKQTEGGVNEPTLKGVWTAGLTYYNNDVVSYSGQSWIATSAVSHVATNDTNATTGYPGAGPWNVYVSKGDDGAGVVYRGDFNTTETYFNNVDRKDIVRQTANATYPYWIFVGTDATVPGVGNPPPTSGNTATAFWKSFGAQFTSVATGLLLAENATITKGLVIGQAGSDVGFIRSATATTILLGNGFYISADGSIRFGDDALTGDNFVYWDGAELNIKGNLNISQGSVGGWIVDSDALGGSLRDEDSRIVFNPSIPEIQMYNASNQQKVKINPSDILSSPDSNDIFVSDLESSLSAAGSVTSPNAVSVTYSNYTTNATSSLFTILSSQVGRYEVNGLTSLPSIPVSFAGLPTSIGVTEVPSDYYPLYEYQTHQGYAGPAYVFVELNMEFVSSSGALIHRELLNTGVAFGPTEQPIYYESVIDPFSPTGYNWQFGGSGYSQTGGSFSSTPASPFIFSVNFASAGDYAVRYSTRVGVRSTYEDTARSDGSRITDFTTITRGGESFSTLDSTLTLSFPVNFVELTGGGFQAVTDSTQYVKINRASPGETNPQLMRIQGGQIWMDHTDSSQLTFINFSNSELYGGARIGGDWSSDLTKPKKLAINGGLQFQTTFTYVNAGGLTTATRLAPELARGYSIIGVRNTGGNSSYQLPFYQDGTYNDADWNNFEAGHIVIIFNTDDATSCQVRGLVQNVQTAPNNGYTEIPGGVCWMLFYQGGRVSAINGSRSNHWVVISAFDNNF